MKRRSLLAALFAAPMLPIVAFAKNTPTDRLSGEVTAREPGYVTASFPVDASRFAVTERINLDIIELSAWIS